MMGLKNVTAMVAGAAGRSNNWKFTTPLTAKSAAMKAMAV
jgi:hypothetical protein